MYSCGVRGAHGGLRRRESGTPAGTSRVYCTVYGVYSVLYMRGSSYTGAGAQLRANSGHNQSISGNTHLVNINSNKCTLVTRSWAVAGDLKMI